MISSRPEDLRDPVLAKLAKMVESGSMPTRNISLTREQDAFIDQVVATGEYQNASEAVRDALRTLQQRRREDALKLKALRAAIKVGQDALDRGDYDDVDDSQLEGYLDSLTAAGRKRTR
jgi:antitoxin ParD1/3/4